MARPINRKYYSCPEGTHYCTRCDNYKPLDDFNDDKKKFNGKYCYCKQCAKAYVQKHTVRRSLQMKRVNYGIAEYEYLRLFEQQGGVCAVCGNPETKLHKGTLVTLSVDHNHETGKVRGLLCCTCNAGLGAFRDDRDLLQKAVDYLHETDEERTQNPRTEKVNDSVDVEKEFRELTREVKGLPKQLSGSMSDTEGLPLFSAQH